MELFLQFINLLVFLLLVVEHFFLNRRLRNGNKIGSQIDGHTRGLHHSLHVQACIAISRAVLERALQRPLKNLVHFVHGQAVQFLALHFSPVLQLQSPVGCFPLLLHVQLRAVLAFFYLVGNCIVLLFELFNLVEVPLLVRLG